MDLILFIKIYIVCINLDKYIKSSGRDEIFIERKILMMKINKINELGS